LKIIQKEAVVAYFQ